MNVTFACPRCEQPARVEIDPAQSEYACPRCQQVIHVPAGAIDEGRVRRCLACPSTDLYLRKDFPQRLGVALVVLGFAASTVAWGFGRPILTFAILFATALVDVVLYLAVPNALMCYRCGAQYRGLPGLDGYEGFHLETHERYRQQRMRLAEQKKAAATHADAK